MRILSAQLCKLYILVAIVSMSRVHRRGTVPGCPPQFPAFQYRNFNQLCLLIGEHYCILKQYGFRHTTTTTCVDPTDSNAAFSAGPVAARYLGLILLLQ